MKIFSGTGNEPLSQAIASHLGLRLGTIATSRFSDGELFIEILENVRGEDVFFVQSTSTPANDHAMELLIALDAFRRGSARRITALMPYYGYARQDRKSGPRTPITAKLMANLITIAGAHRCLTVDLHAGQIQGFFDIPLDNLYAAPVMIDDIDKHYRQSQLVVVSPDVGGVVRARSLASQLNAGLAIIDKRREHASVSEVMHIIGEVADKDCLIIDDIIDTAGTLCNAAAALHEEGARSVCAYSSHGVLSGGAVARIEASVLTRVVITDSIKASDAVLAAKKIETISIAPLLAEAIQRIHREESVSDLFVMRKQGKKKEQEK